MPLLTIKQIMADSVRLATTDADPKDRYAVGAFNFSTIPEMVGLVDGRKPHPVLRAVQQRQIKRQHSRASFGKLATLSS